MSCWSAENATKAYLSTLKMSQRAKEPAVAEFISALAAGNNAQVMVVACATVVDSTTLALVAAANQTGGHVVCIVQGNEELKASKNVLGMFSCQVQFIVGDAKDLLLNQYDAADFVLIDCNLVNHEEIFRVVQGGKQNGTMVVGYNAFRCKGSCGSKTHHLLPIGEGLLVTRFGANGTTSPKYGPEIRKNRSHWVKRVDKCTGEEHVYRVRFPQGKVIQA
ncbi:putative S-adenosyl-L-methionine-dependent methyltransferase [Lupinus albus]|uniref:Putative S-adenosyl-L-methionine-dependent methyltransferase n=1 Tax=Lupinus albus TaxID=3870 RepID=A0A6A4QVF6_LUPAL|nr:putative S-adenosyl-L-methionine-dependent methyltransferase [Lupinus albus]